MVSPKTNTSVTLPEAGGRADGQLHFFELPQEIIQHYTGPQQCWCNVKCAKLTSSKWSLVPECSISKYDAMFHRSKVHFALLSLTLFWPWRHGSGCLRSGQKGPLWILAFLPPHVESWDKIFEKHPISLAHERDFHEIISWAGYLVNPAYL